MSNRTSKLVSLAAIGLLAATAASGWTPTASVSIPSPVPPPPAFGVLYDQIGPVSALGRAQASQNFETAFDAFDSEATDDFSIASGLVWNVQRVVVDGLFSPGMGPTNSVDVFFYGDSGGSPGGTLCTYTGMTPVNGLLDADFAVDLSPTCDLGAGTFWVEVVSNQDSINGGWFWHKIDQTVPQILSVAHWRNPGNGFGTGCTTFAPMNTCGTIEVNTDLAFRLEGIEIIDTDLSITKTMDNEVPNPGDTVVFTISVTNNGPADATGVVVTDTLPTIVTYVSDDCGGADLPPWTWNIGNLAASTTVTCNITADVDPNGSGAHSNTATVTGNETDPDQDDNTATVYFVVSLLSIPTLGKAGIAALLILLASAGVILVRRLA